MRRRGRTAHGGFSLSELLTVMAILALLAGIILAAMGPMKERARVAACMSNLRQIGLAYQLYRADYDAYPDPTVIWAAPRGSPYLSDHRVLFCPSDTDLEGPTYTMATSYVFHMTVPPDMAPLSGMRTVDPEAVLVVCDKHVQQREEPLRDGTERTRLTAPVYPYHLLLRADGRVDRVHISRVRRLYPYAGRTVSTLIYPGEPGYDRARN